MTKLLALLDSNVVLASVAEAHQHHEPSNALFRDFPAQSFAVAAHSFSEAYASLTRKAPTSPFRWSAEDAIAALESVAARCALVGLTHAQTFDTVRVFASEGGIGPRLYDKLIGQTAVLNGLDAIVTWNLGHMRSLFPALDVLDPASFAEGLEPPPEKRALERSASEACTHRLPLAALGSRTLLHDAPDDRHAAPSGGRCRPAMACELNLVGYEDEDD